MNTSVRLWLCWAGLMVLSLGTVWSGAAGVVVLLEMVKGWVIVDGFMELRHGPWKWRVAMLGWGLVVLAGIVGLSA